MNKLNILRQLRFTLFVGSFGFLCLGVAVTDPDLTFRFIMAGLLLMGLGFMIELLRPKEKNDGDR